MKRNLSTLAFLVSMVIITLMNPSCETVTDLIFPVEKDVQLGMQVKDEIVSKPNEFPILPESQYREAYTIVRSIKDDILNSGNVEHKDDFAWEVKIIHDDNTLNAFCAPGGYIYVYTGLIKYLDTEDQFAGVMAHEIAHADRRHTVKNMQKQFGTQFLLDVVLGQNADLVKQIGTYFLSLRYSRSHERDADDYSVIYLSGTQYNCTGSAGFFEKIEAQGGASVPQFMSTHPSPDNRVEEINAKGNELNCEKTESNTEYQKLKNALP